MFKKAQGTDTLYTSVLKQRHVRPATAKKVCKKKTKPVVRVSGLDDVSPYTLPLNTSHKEQLRRRDKPFPSVHVPSLRPEQQTLHNHFFRRHQLQLLQSHWESKATGRWCPSEQRIVTDGYRNQVVRRICFERLRLRIETLWEELKIPKTERRHITATYMSDGAIPDAVFCQNYVRLVSTRSIESLGLISIFTVELFVTASRIDDQSVAIDSRS